MDDHIKLRGARTHNLKNINLDIPLGQFTIVTGLSGSGKSSLAFDTIYAEGQRRYVESLSTYTRQFLEKMPKPDIDTLENICPSLALEQKNHIQNNRSTVATMCELYDYFSLLYAKIGQTFCLQCQELVQINSPQTISKDLLNKPPGNRFYVLAPLSNEVLDKSVWIQTRKALLQSGFERIALQTEDLESDIHDLIASEVIPKKIKAIYLVIDRMSMPDDPTKDSRLFDALEQALIQGKGFVTLAFIEKDSLLWKYKHYSNLFRCDQCSLTYEIPEPQFFSFNSPIGACNACSGFGFNLELDEDLIVPDKRITIQKGAVDPFTKPAYRDWHESLLKFCEKHKINTGKTYDSLTSEQKQLIWNGDGTKRGFQGIHNCFEELKAWKYKLYVRVFIRRYQSQNTCSQCHGSRLNPKINSVKISNTSFPQTLEMSISTALQFFKNLQLTASEKTIAKNVLTQIINRLQFLNDVGVAYLTLNRLSKTLSGGECQRISLATQLGNQLSSTLYVLDEPSIGLHPADTSKLIHLMHKLRDQGNTLLVVEHDLDVIRAADYMIELGPNAGHRGGEVIAQGSLDHVLNQKGCLTAKYLTGVFSIPKRLSIRKPGKKHLRIEGACANNLQNINVDFPLHQLIAVSGLSGSGKTSLIHHTLYNALARIFHNKNVIAGKFHRLYGTDFLQDVILLDQKPIGKSSRSNPATYLKIWDDIRKIYSNQSLAIRQGYSSKHFSFNTDGGRCPTCKGEGEVSLDMHFMADLKLPCEECDGKKFKKSILDVEYKKKNIYDLLRTTIYDCIDLFREYPSITSKLQLLKNVGLDYLELGQSSTTLSGGESQRLKIAAAIQNRTATNALYIFDEPTTGLHLDDVSRLLQVLHNLVEQQNTVIVIEHNLELIAQADWVLDLGPGAGVDGGLLVAQGTPEQISQNPNSLTGKFLSRILNQ